MKIIKYILNLKKIKKWNNKYIISYPEYFKIIDSIKLVFFISTFLSVYFISSYFNNNSIFINFLIFYIICMFIFNFMQSLGGFHSYGKFDILFWMSHSYTQKSASFLDKNIITSVEEKITKEGTYSIVKDAYQSDIKKYYLNNKLHCLEHGAVIGTGYSSFDFEVEEFYIDGIKIKEEDFEKEVKAYLIKNKIEEF
jgi:hypothetical protein